MEIRSVRLPVDACSVMDPFINRDATGTSQQSHPDPILKNADVVFDARLKSRREITGSNEAILEFGYEGSTFEIVCPSLTTGKEAYANVQKQNPGSLIRITGTIRPSTAKHRTDDSNDSTVGLTAVWKDDASSLSHVVNNLHVKSMVVVAKAFPNQPVVHGGLEHRLDNRILDLRAAASGLVFKLQSGMFQLIVEFLTKNDFVWLQTPRIRGSHVAGDNEYFHLPYFGRDAWLTQHTQHALQNAIAADMQRVFDIGPVFRAEAKSSSSSRHLTEFTLLGINMTYQNDWHEAVDMIGSMLTFVIRGLQERQQFKSLLDTVRKYYPSSQPFQVGLDKDGRVPRITWRDAKRMLREELGRETSDDEDLTPEEEAALGRHFRESPHLGHTDLFAIEHFPLSMRQFNSVPVSNAPELSETWDFIARGREICSGSHRISDHDELCQAMRSGTTGPSMDPESEEWKAWMNAFKLGMPPHAGASLGVNRIFQAFLGLDDIREATLFPRDKNRLAP